jgi:pyridine nucleotide-disulfide oxidoreductase family protein
VNADVPPEDDRGGRPPGASPRASRRLLLVGCGHAQVAVLQDLARGPRPGDVATTLVTPANRLAYSGMLPGWIAGHYGIEECSIDVERLAHAADATLVIDRVVALDADRRTVELASGRRLGYDLLSLDVGSDIDTSRLDLAQDRLLPLRPLEALVARWPAIRTDAARRGSFDLVVVGGGAAGFEVALAARQALRAAPGVRVTLVASARGLLDGHASGVRGRARRRLQGAGITLHEQDATAAGDALQLADGRRVPADAVLAATGPRAPAWLRGTGLSLDEAGYVRVDETLRSRSHPDVYAAGDVVSRSDVPVTRSGVQAVRAGPTLSTNLVAALRGATPRRHRVRRRSLFLLSCGEQVAIASWGGLAAQGHWVWRWKDRIDRRFIARFDGSSRPGRETDT